MKKSHAGAWIGLAIVFIAAVYSALVFIIKNAFDVSAWLLYGFTMIAFVLVALQTFMSVKTGSGIVISMASGVVTAVYFCLQLIFGGIIGLCFSDLPVIPVLTIQVILLAAFISVTFIIYGAQSHMAAQVQNDHDSVFKIRMLENSIEDMVERQTDPVLKKKLKALAEETHYSDVVNLPALTEVEGQILQNITILQEELTNENADQLTRIETIHRLLKERNRMAAILKKS